MIEILGWIGSICLSLCGLPLVIRTIKDGHSNGVDSIFLVVWLVGEIAALLYSLDKDVLPLLINYGFNIVFITIVIWYKTKEIE